MQYPLSSETLTYDTPSVARIYDALLGGYRSFDCDRQVVASLLRYYPDMPLIAQVTRSFLRRTMEFLLEQGIDQFLDIGSGLPTQGNVHEIVHAVNSDARVVYVDVDPVAVSYSEAILAATPNAVTIQGDVRQPDRILAHRETQRFLDFQRPVALSLVGVLHYVLDDCDAASAITTLMDSVVPGSYLVVLHTALECVTQEGEVRRSLFGPIASTKHRRWIDVAAFFRGLTLVDPGLVYTPLWRPSGPDALMIDSPESAFSWAGVGCREPRYSDHG